jgi:hypothetical protein
MGHAVAHWEGDTLVVESNGYKDRSWLDGDGHPTPKRCASPNAATVPTSAISTFRSRWTIPGIFTKAFTFDIKMTLHADTEMLEYGDYCRRRRSPLELQRRGSARLEPVSEKTWWLAGRLIEFEDFRRRTCPALLD